MCDVEAANREASRQVQRAGRVRAARRIARPCGLCDAPAGEPCIDISRGYQRPPHKNRLRALTAAAALTLAVVATGCWGTTEAMCRVDDLPEHPCPAQIVSEQGDAVGAVTGSQIIDWYGQLEPGLHTFTVRSGDASDSWVFEVIPELPEGAV